MREPSLRELFLQNLLARSSTLLYEAVQILDENATGAQRALLVIEAQTWFRETRTALIQALEAPEDVGATSTPAVSAVNNGQNWKSPVNIPASTSSTGLAENTEQNTNSGERSSNPSFGGNSSPVKKQFKSSLLNF